MLKTQIINKLKRLKVDFDPSANKADLEALLEEALKPVEEIEESVEELQEEPQEEVQEPTEEVVEPVVEQPSVRSEEIIVNGKRRMKFYRPDGTTDTKLIE